MRPLRFRFALYAVSFSFNRIERGEAAETAKILFSRYASLSHKHKSSRHR